MSDKVEVLRRRHEIFKAVRAFFDTRDFIEVHTPSLVKNPGLEPWLIPFETELLGNASRSRGTRYLPTSPEIHLKKALALGLERIYEITRSYRNAEESHEHEPEFFMLEWYRHPGDYRAIADDFAALLGELGARFSGAKSWAKRQDMTVAEAFKRYAGLDIESGLVGPGPTLTEQALKLGHASVKESDNFDDTFFKTLVEKIEPKLGFEGPLFLWDYPAHQCAMARIKAENPLFCERFEVYWRGIELANAFGEVTDAAEQRRRCEEDRQKRIELYGKSPALDESFLEALQKLMHPAGGIAVGLDRVVQCLIGAPRLQDIIAFPHVNRL